MSRGRDEKVQQQTNPTQPNPQQQPLLSPTLDPIPPPIPPPIVPEFGIDPEVVCCDVVLRLEVEEGRVEG